MLINEIDPHPKEYVIFLAAVLNSSLTYFLLEGGVLELTVYECGELPILDPKKLSEDEKKELRRLFKVYEAQRKGDEKLEREARIEIDDIVFDALGLNEDECKQV